MFVISFLNKWQHHKVAGTWSKNTQTEEVHETKMRITGLLL